ncbi:hypothetical protein [Crystallibacter degradans]|uniref:hypothetical protein n=1 Tax=Crystallibacter degradans TaxID=2726743 RepID=UPI001475C6A7|nr:hypothetical protein [Arthrobacter sp. SF27]NMR30519.1 hypothetical protein [Arthrobacter sp. SF27]
MSAGNRKPLIIAAVCAAVAVVVFALGAGFGGQGADGAAGWQDRFGGLELSAGLDISELQPAGGNCRLDGDRITITGSCTLAVGEFGGPFSLQATKHAELVPAAPVNLMLAVEGTSTQQDVGAGCGINLVFGRSGGALTLTCQLITVPCAVELGQGRDCSKE